MTDQDYINQLYSTFQPMVKEFLSLCHTSGIDVKIAWGYRSIEQQNILYAQGRTTPGSIVTNARGGESVHNFGLAIDVCKSTGYPSSSDPYWNKLEQIGNEVGLEHGDRGFTDLPHFQYRGGLSLAQLQQGQRPPLLSKYQPNDDEDMTPELKQELQDIKNHLQVIEDMHRTKPRDGEQKGDNRLKNIGDHSKDTNEKVTVLFDKLVK